MTTKGSEGSRFVAPLVYPMPTNNVLRDSTSFPSLPIPPARLSTRHARKLRASSIAKTRGMDTDL